MNPCVSPRGFKHFEATETDRGETVRVYESSVADGPHLWLSVTGEAHLDGPPKPHAGVPFGIAPGGVAAHLALEQAREVRDALNAAIDGHYQCSDEPAGGLSENS